MAPLNSKILTIIKCGVVASTRPVLPPRLKLIGTLLIRSTRSTRLFSVTCRKHLILILRLPLTLMILTPSLLSRILTLTLISFKFFLYP